MNLFNTSALDFSTYCIEKYGTIENLQRKAKSGEITAQVDLGTAYSEGLGEELPKDTDLLKEAVNYLLSSRNLENYWIRKGQSNIGERRTRCTRERHDLVVPHHRLISLKCIAVVWKEL